MTTSVAHDLSESELTSSAKWKTIQWNKVDKAVARTQDRIAKASSLGKWRKVRDLQRLLIKSLPARLKAVKRVAQDNQGKNTAGIDGLTWTTPKQKYQGAISLTEKKEAKPMKRVYIPKANGKLRPLGIPCIRDRANQALWDLALLPIAEERSDRNSYGFRPYRGTWDAYAQIHLLYSRRNAVKWVLDADIKGFFDHLSHDWLLENIPMDKRILKSWLKAGILIAGKYSDTDEGTPQGGVISPTLANLALTGMESFLAKRFKPGRSGARGKDRRTHRTGINLVRYADDFIITGRSQRQLQRVKEAIKEFLATRGLELSEEKTSIRHISEGFDFLGWNFIKRNGTFLGSVSEKSIQTHMEKLKAIVKENGNAPVETMIAKLNKSITGWVNYHRCCSQIHKTWAYCDHQLYKILWRWARKRHRRKGAIWIKNRYWKQVARRHWTFHSENSYLRIHDARQSLSLKLPAEVKVFRLENQKRIQEFWKRKKGLLLRGDKQKLWKTQQGLCGKCQQLIENPEDKAKVIYIIPKTAGGTEALNNRRLLHDHCRLN